MSSATDIKKTLKLIKDEDVQYVDLRFTDTHGKEQHVSVSADIVDADFLKLGKMFDGSSIAGWKNIDASDMVLMPNLDKLTIDPFFEEATLILRCDILEPNTMKEYERDPRSIAKRAEAYLKQSKIADTCYFGPEPEFFIFDDVRWKVSMGETFFKFNTKEAAWNSETMYEDGNLGHRPQIKGGYFPVPPVDSSQDIRSAMCTTLKEMGYKVETHHHEVASGNQNEINLRFDTLLAKADEVMMLKYVIHNVAQIYGKTATFMPKPIAGDNGSGMHCHQSLFKDGKNLFLGEEYAGLSELALYYIGGIIKHARALNAFTNPGTNSYKRLVPGFEAPVLLAYSERNRSASIRIPHIQNPKGRRIEVRFPDPIANPYLAFSAMMMAGLDGIKNKIHPGDPSDQDLYKLTPKQLEKIPTVCATLDEALQALKKDHQFLLEGDVFTKDMIEAYIQLKAGDVERIRMTPNPIEFDMYYSL
jgi:glutamine synthetase